MWNMQTFLDNTKTDRPERTALVTKELACYKVDIPALGETCLLDEGQLTEHGCVTLSFGVDTVVKNGESQVLDV